MTSDRLLPSTGYAFQRPDREAVAEFLTALPDDAAREGFAHRDAEVPFGLDPALAAGGGRPSGPDVAGVREPERGMPSAPCRLPRA